ncbi:MAG: glycerophosphoryl diester phosphodiesterase [Alphaproteobacteria bacterium]|nr:glycerophosphoryl diester phosphodiesterase [Alphaproteobacteria bacterium]
MHRPDSAASRLGELDLPSVIGHRGAAGVAPENTLGGLRRASALGCRWVEFDVRLTADRELILFHDDRLERTTDSCGNVGALPSSAIRCCDAGAWFDASFAGERVPTLAEAIELLSELGLGANVELKSQRGNAIQTGMAAADLLARLWPQHLPRPLISSFSPDTLEAARYRAPTMARGLLLRGAGGRWRRAEALGCATVNADHRFLRPAVVAQIRNAGYSVLAYTVNEPARARELFAWGVCSVFSDVPHMILAQMPPGLPQSNATPPPLLAGSARREALM